MHAGIEWDEIFKMLKDRAHQHRIMYTTKLSWKTGCEIKTFYDKNWENFPAFKGDVKRSSLEKTKMI